MTRTGIAAPDSFKGTHSAAEVAAAMANGLRAAGLEAKELPLADGGEGTMEALLAARGGRRVEAAATDPLGRPLRAPFALLEDGSAVVEVAAASGLGLVAEPERDAWRASTRGTGELIAAALEAGGDPVLVAAGGSATTDGGEGALAALRGVATQPRLIVLCDVETPFEDAAGLFGPQKGADASTVRRLEERLAGFAASAPRDPRGARMTGAAGGLAGGLWAHLGAELVPGARYVLDAAGFDRKLAGASTALTGEGRLDETTLEGKVVAEVARRCRSARIDCHAIVGESRLDIAAAKRLGLASVSEAPSLAQVEQAAERRGRA